ncbi:MAG: hypothetical protein Q4D07_01380 [Selenomonadaceae bacterium]|nr:hypothetical protein [Selenomonadaceae bacterium]
MIKRYLALVLSILCLLTWSGGTALAAGTIFLSQGDTTFLYLNKKEVRYVHDDETISFLLQKGGRLLLTDGRGSRAFLEFAAYDGTTDGVGYAVRKLCSANPNNTFYEILADAGAHGENVGYWVIGKRDGRWVKYVTIDSLAAIGYNAHSWHRIRSEIKAGELVVISTREYIAPGSKDDSKTELVDDWKFQLNWDEEGSRFEIKCVTGDGSH